MSDLCHVHLPGPRVLGGITGRSTDRKHDVPYVLIVAARRATAARDAVGGATGGQAAEACGSTKKME